MAPYTPPPARLVQERRGAPRTLQLAEGGLAELDLVSVAARGPEPFRSVGSIREGVQEMDLHKPIGLCLLQSGALVVASSFEDKVKLYRPEGGLDRTIALPNRKWRKPSDMVALAGGQFVVRDDLGLHMFTSSGEHMRQLAGKSGSKAKCYGLAEDDQGRMVTIIDGPGRAACLVFFDVAADKMVKERSLGDIIEGEDVFKSMCRFLTHSRGRLYVVDLGLDRVYVLDCSTGELIKKFGASGKGPGCFNDPAGLGVDGQGNMVVADSRNHRVCIYTKEGSFVSDLHLQPPVRRPSGLLLDRERKELYVLNLSGQLAMVKYSLQ